MGATLTLYIQVAFTEKSTREEHMETLEYNNGKYCIMGATLTLYIQVAFTERSTREEHMKNLEYNNGTGPWA